METDVLDCNHNCSASDHCTHSVLLYYSVGTMKSGDNLRYQLN